MPHGAHTLVFTSPTDPRRTSTTDVVVASGVSVVRHAIGRQKPMNAGILGGASLVVLGTFFTLGGAIFTGSGFSGEQRDAQGNVYDSSSNLPIGLALAGIGLGLGALGIVIVENSRAEHQPGTTMQFRAP